MDCSLDSGLAILNAARHGRNHRRARAPRDPQDMAAHTLLLKLEAQGLIHLPPRRQSPSNLLAGRRQPRQN